MPTRSISGRSFKPTISLLLLTVVLVALWLAGGASRADAMGQVVVRIVVWVAVIIAVLFCERPPLKGAKPVLLILSGAASLALLHLVPLPPSIWQVLPGREIFGEAASASGQAQPWRPLSIVPAATANAVASLIVPSTVLFLILGLNDRERSWLPGILLCLVTASAVIGLLQFSGAGFNNPFVNDTPGQVSGTFANRNHFALLLAMGCLFAPAWAFLDGRRPEWRGPVSLGLVLLFTLTILASGSRAGMIVGVLALGLALMLARQGLRRELRRAPRWVLPAIVAAIIGTFTIFVLISIAANRAESITRAVAIDTDDDMRARAFSTVLHMVQTYFPVGAGFGGFDPLFRMDEPFGLLKFTYFNHAHNDFLEIVLDGGLPALLLLTAALGWWALASVRTWRAADSPGQTLPKVGSAALLLVLIASTVDYPARVPMIMAMVVIAGVWLGSADTRRASSLPQSDQHL